MKKLFLLFSVLTLLAICSCSFKRSMGMVNDQLVLRDWYGDTCLESTLGDSFNTVFSEWTTGNFIHNTGWETANYTNYFSFGFGVYQTVYKNSFIRLNAGIKYSDTIRLNIYETASDEFNNGYHYYVHDITVEASYFNSQSFSLVFPDIEIQTPFLEALKFIVKADLLTCYLDIDGAKIKYKYNEKNNTVTGVYEYSYALSQDLPYYGRFFLSSNYVTLGSFKLGLIYYFN